jgi:hypothetical protein
MTVKPDLETVDSCDLMDELRRRYPSGGIIVVVRPLEDNSPAAKGNHEFRNHYWGPAFIQQGMARHEDIRTMRLMYAILDEDPINAEGDEDGD